MASSGVTRAGSSGAPSNHPGLDASVARHGNEPSRLLPMLHDVMAADGFVAPATISELARLLGIPRGQVEGVLGFYSFFASEPRGLSAAEFERRLAFADVPCAGAFMVFDGTRDLLQIVENFARFFAHESCGFCTPCRVGTTLNARAMARIASGRGSRRDIGELLEVSRLLRSASHCGLGTTAANPVLDGISKFRPSFERRLRSLEVLPTFDLDEALAPAREITARDDPDAHLSDEARGG